MAVQEITYNDIKSAILEALSEHDMEVQRYGSADTKLRSETKDLTLKLLEEVKFGFKQEKDNDTKLINEIKNNIKKQEQNSNITNGSSISSTDKSDIDKWNKFLDKTENFLHSAAKKFDNFIDNMVVKTALSLHAASNDATEIVADSLSKLNSNGIGQDWDQFRQGLKGSKIQLDDLNKAIAGHTQAFGSLNKLTGNAVGTYQKLATKAAEYATDEAKLAYDSSQTADAVNAYLEMQRSTGNLDRLNEKEMQSGINKLIKSGDELAKEYGISRDALIKAMQKQEDDLDIALMGQGKSPEEIAEVKAQIAALEESGQTELANLIKKSVASGGTDRDALAKLAYLNSNTMSAGMNDIMAGNIAEGVKKMASEQAMRETEESFKKQGSSAGIMNIHGGAAVSGANKIALQSQRARTSRNAEAKDKTDETIVKKQALDNEKIEKANNNLFIMSKTAATANHYFDTMTATLKAVNAGLKKFGEGLDWLSGLMPGIMGWGSALLQGAGALADIVTAYNSFRGGGLRGRAGGIKRSLRRAKLRTKPGVRNKARTLRSKGGFGLKPRGRGGFLGRIARWGAGALGVVGLGSALAGSDENSALDTAADVADMTDMANEKTPKSAKNAKKAAKSTAKKATKSTAKKTATKSVAKIAEKNAAKVATKTATQTVAKTAAGGVLKGALKGGAAGIVAGVGSAVIDEYGAQGLEALGVGEKSAKVTANAASSALEGAAWGAMVGSVIPVVGTAVGAGVGALVGGVGSLIKSAFSSSDDKEENEQEQSNSEEKEKELETKKAEYEAEKLEEEKLKEQFSTNTEQNPEYSELSNIASNSNETNQILSRILYAIEANNQTNI